jgi:hypothetical protein
MGDIVKINSAQVPNPLGRDRLKPAITPLKFTSEIY